MNSLQKDNWAQLLKCCHVINSSYNILHMQQQHSEIITGMCGCIQTQSHTIHWQACMLYKFVWNLS